MAKKNNVAILTVADTSHPVGPDIVDHTAHLDASPDEDSREGQGLFRSRFLEAPRHDKLKTADHERGGITPKTFFRIGGQRDEKGRVKPSKTFMIKPYHEDMEGWEEAHMPLGGWAEMVWMRMLHAANLGHMAMRGHTFEYNGTPLLAIEIQKGMHRMDDVAGSDYDSVIEDNAAKLATMDFLLNHQDRHSGNLLVDAPSSADVSNILAIDNGRSLQYTHANRFGGDTSKGDHLFNYWYAPGFNSILPKTGLKRLLASVTDWWERNRPAIKREFRSQLSMIQDSKVSKHISRSFGDRVKALNNLVRDFRKRGAEPYEKGIAKHHSSTWDDTPRNNGVIKLADRRMWANVKVPVRSFEYPKVDIDHEEEDW